MARSLNSKVRRGFTLVELLVVIAIIASSSISVKPRRTLQLRDRAMGTLPFLGKLLRELI